MRGKDERIGPMDLIGPISSSRRSYGPRDRSVIFTSAFVGALYHRLFGELIWHWRWLGCGRWVFHFTMIDDVAEVGGIESFKLEQGLGDEFYFIAAFVEDAGSDAEGVIDEVLDFFIDDLGGALAVVGAAAAHIAAAKEDGAIALAVFHHAELIAHAPFANHVAREGRSLADIARGTV